MPLITLLTKTGTVHQTGGLNWGTNAANHTRYFDAYIPLHIDTIRANPGFFPPKAPVQNILTFTWDDGTIMQGQFEGNLPDQRTGILYPKNICSYPHKDTLGLYFRSRLGVIGAIPVTMQHLNTYGRTTVEITHTGGNNYNIDFHI